VNRDFFMGNLLELGYEKIPLLATALFRGDYRCACLGGVT